MVQRVLDESQINEAASQQESRRIMRILAIGAGVALLILAGGLFIW